MVEKSVEKGKKNFVVWEGVLKNAEEGKVCTRFPPEPSGYLHIGHIKAVILNRFFADMYKGKMIVRFDDTNPEKESLEFVDNIVEDIKRAGISWEGEITHVTDYFELCEDHMTKLIEKGICYCDNTSVEKTREERDKGIPSKCRENSIEENMAIWKQMIDKNIPKDSPIREYCVRGKIDPKSKNKCMRDPVFYRFVDKPHHRLGDKYKLYPMYDFSIPIVDHIGGVTHMLRSNEYADRIPMYKWVEKAVGLPEMNIFEYSRMNLVNTVLSKRKLKWLVENQKVSGWDDPRLPTLRGILRRGIRVESIKNFILEIGPSTNSNLMKWDKLYAINKDIIDPTAKRFFGVSAENPVVVELENFDDKDSIVQVDWHQKNIELGKRDQIRSKKLFIEPEDAADLTEGAKLTLYKWGNTRVSKIEKNDKDEIVKVVLKLTPEDQDFKKTKVAHWVSAKEGDTIVATIVEFDHIINKEKIEENDNMEDIVNENSRFETPVIVEKCILDSNEKDCVQLERRGYYYIDHLDKENKKVVLHYIPDGKSKTMSIVKSKVDPKNLAQGSDTLKIKKAEKKAENEKKKAEKKEKKEQNKDAKPEEKKEEPKKE